MTILSVEMLSVQIWLLIFPLTFCFSSLIQSTSCVIGFIVLLPHQGPVHKIGEVALEKKSQNVSQLLNLTFLF